MQSVEQRFSDVYLRQVHHAVKCLAYGSRRNRNNGERLLEAVIRL
jgi:hypothetical protein